MVGKNLDWRKGPIVLLRTIPETGYSTLSVVDLSLCDIFGLRKMKYALLTAPYVPFDGMNDQGLTISMLSVQSSAAYPDDTGKVSVGDFNVIRIILDRCATIDDVVETFDQYKVVQSGPLPIHYLITDKHEACLVELAEKRVSVIRGEHSTCVTNFLKMPSPNLKSDERNCVRYQAMEQELRAKSGLLSVAEAKRLLARVSVYRSGYAPPSTIWSVLFAPESLELSVRIGNMGPYYRVGL